jgi:hypothetical protein
MASDVTKEEWCILWDRAKSLERTLPERRKEALSALKAKHPNLPYKNWSGVSRAIDAGKLPPHVLDDAAPVDARLRALAEEAATARRRSDQLLAEKHAAEKRPLLNPDVDAIPPGVYPKLADCTEYPLRRDCNYGENATARWDRCGYMVYGGIPGVWKCGAPSALGQR